jgi:glucosamine kinase
MVDYVIGVDGGGTGTRVRLANRLGIELAQGVAGPSALGQGLESAWTNILQAITLAFNSCSVPVPHWSRCILAAGLSGNGHQAWREGFLALNPGFVAVLLESDATTMLLGAHAGKPGVMVTAGTGSIGEALYADGSRREVGGWGFPVGDEGSGAWLGLRAMAHAHAAEDGREAPGALSRQVRAHCGDSAAGLLAWCADARQFKYAQLALLVFDAADADPVARDLLAAAARELERLANVLDPQGQLPVAVCGSVGKQLIPRLSAALQLRCVAPAQDATQGALLLALKYLEDHP